MKRILFYEFSDPSREPIPFHAVEDFMLFCKQHDLVSELTGNIHSQMNGINDNGSLKCMCIEGTHLVMCWADKDVPSKFFQEWDVSVIKDFADETFSADTTWFSVGNGTTKIVCGKKNKFNILAWGDTPNYAFYRIMRGNIESSHNMTKCFTEDCGIISAMKNLQKTAKKALLIPDND